MEISSKTQKANYAVIEDQIKRYREERDLSAIGPGQKQGLPKLPERFSWLGHKHRITGVDFHPLHDILASGSDDSSIKLWDSESGEIDKTLKGHTSKINSLWFNKQGTLIASCSKDMIKLWSLESFQCIKTITAHEHNISKVKFMPSGDQLISSSWDKTLKLWELSTGYWLKTYEGHEEKIYSFDINEKGDRIISASKKPEIIYWDWGSKTDRPILNIFEEEHENAIDIVVFVPLSTAETIILARQDQDDEKELQTGGNIEKEESKEEEEKTMEKQTSSETKPRFAKAEALRKAREKKAQILQRVTGKKKGSKEDEKIVESEENERTKRVVVKDEFVASGCRDKRIKIWNTRSGVWIMNLIGHDQWVNDIIFHPNGKYLLSASDDKSVRIWDMSKNGVWIKKLLNIHIAGISSICISRKSLATGSVDKSVKIFNLQ